MRALVIENDAETIERLRGPLEATRLEVEVVGDGAAGLRMARDGTYGLIVLDVQLPGLDGWSVCRLLRDARDPTPVLILSARGSVVDRVRGLEAGADDYVVEPFDPREFTARVRALLRRGKVHKQRLVRVADLELDTVSGRVARGGVPVHLTPREYALLEALVLNEGRVLTRDMIREGIWEGEGAGSNTISVHLKHLRRKIDSARSDRLIQTIQGVGYLLRRPDSEPLA